MQDDPADQDFQTEAQNFRLMKTNQYQLDEIPSVLTFLQFFLLPRF